VLAGAERIRLPDHASTSQQIQELKRDIAEQQALVCRTVLQGFPSQAAEDRLCALQQKLAQLTRGM
jgi:hypothetical protein